MVALARSQVEPDIQLTEIYRLSVDQYHQMIRPEILHDGDPLELLEGLLLRKWPTRYRDSLDTIYIEQFYPLSVQQYEEMGRLGILSSDDRVELLEGVIFKRMPIFPPHTGTVLRLTDTIKPKLPAGWRYRQEQPIVLSDGEPMPDGVVATGTDEDNFLFHPLGKDVALVIEVADSTLDRDRGIKLRSYSRAGIICYWIINLIDRQIEVYTQPDAAAPTPTYGSMEIFKAGQSVPLSFNGNLIAQVAVDELLPTAS
jgi:hypothetical protein